MGSVFSPVLDALDKARLNPDQVDAVVLNGGSCRNPLLVRAFRELDVFRNAEIIEGDLDLAVARGAAIRCFYKHCRDYDPITPIVSAEIGLITHGDKCQMLVPAGTLLPFPTKDEFKRFTDRFWIPKERMAKIHLPIYSGKEGNRYLVQTMTLEVPPDATRGERVVVELKIDANKIMRFRAFLAERPTVALDITLENPLAMRSLSPEQRAALEKRKHFSCKRRENRLYQPSVDDWVDLANLERLAKEPERALEILQRLQGRLKKHNQALPASAHNIFGLCYGALGRSNLRCEHYGQATELEPAVGAYAANYGCALSQAGKPEEAIPHLKRAITADPEDGYPYVVLGDALSRLGLEAEAVKEFQEGKRRLEIQLRTSPHSQYLLGWAEGVCRRLSEYDDMAAFRRRKMESARTAYLGASSDDLVAGMDSGIVHPGELTT
jgi:tetratricopeptide (TPR) repeat protein